MDKRDSWSVDFQCLVFSVVILMFQYSHVPILSCSKKYKMHLFLKLCAATRYFLKCMRFLSVNTKITVVHLQVVLWLLYVGWHLRFRQPYRFTETLMFSRCHSALTLNFTSFCWHKWKLYATPEHTWFKDFDEVKHDLVVRVGYTCPGPSCDLTPQSGAERVYTVLAHSGGYGLSVKTVIQTVRNWSWVR